MLPRSETLDLVFGEASKGASPEERAQTSDRKFVRSQTTLAFDSPQAGGRRLSALEALTSFGWETLLQAASEGSSVIVTGRLEPATTLSKRREALNLRVEDVAKAIGVSSDDILRMEKPGTRSPIRQLERAAQALALDERVLGFEPSGRGDAGLGVRLRELAEAHDSTHFTPSTVLKLSEAAWVVRRQIELQRALGELGGIYAFADDLISHRYEYPTWQRGYELAQRVRERIGLSPTAPIPSLKVLLESELGIPLVQERLDKAFAGATLDNASTRGIVINEAGRNSNVWVRRMTLAHELGHLVGDPSQRLNQLRADAYDTIEQDVKRVIDPVEMRANGFAIAFLAPPVAMREYSRSLSSNYDLLVAVTSEFGISRTAATHHLRNVDQRDVSDVHPNSLPEPSDDWLARENLTADYFPLTSTPLSRRGRFAVLTLKAYELGYVSADTAAFWLKSSVEDFVKSVSVIKALTA